MKTNLLKSIFISLILVMGVSNAWAWDLPANGYIYFVKPSQWATAQFMIGNSGYSIGYSMTSISNTRLYYYKTASWGGYGQSGFIDASSTWGGENNAIGNRKTWASHSADVYTSELINSSNMYGLFTSTYKDTHDTDLSFSRGSSYTICNKTQTIGVQVWDGSAYSAPSTSPATVTASTYNLKSATASQSASTSFTAGATATGTKTVSAAYSATVSLSYSNLANGYTFVGWYDSNDNEVGSSYEVTGTKTVYARFQENTYTVTVTNDGHGTTNPSGAQSNVGQVTGLDIEADPATNYEFVNWTITSGSGSFGSETSASTTFKPTSAATIRANFRSTATNTLTVAAGAGIASVTGSEDPVTLGNTYPITATPKTGYTFSTWTANPAANATFGNATTANTNVTVKNGSVIVTASATENMSTLTTSNQYDAGDPGYEVPAASVNSIGYETTATITATNDDAYTLTSWTLTNCTRTDGGADNATTITVRSNGDGKAATVTANYTENPYVYFVNTVRWATVNIYAWVSSDDQNKNGNWPGIAMTKEPEKISGYDVYKYVMPSGKNYDKLVFNQGNDDGKTGDLEWVNGKYYVYSAGQWVDKNEVADLLPSTTIYFKNNPKWTKVYVYFLTGENYGDLGASSYGLTEANKRCCAMTQIGTTDVWKYDYGDSGVVPGNVIAFTEAKQPNYGNFHNTKAAYRTDFNSGMELFIPQEASNETKNGTKYFSKGLWMKYNSTESGYTITGDFNGWNEVSDKFTSETSGGYIFQKELLLSSGNTYEFKIKNIKNDWFRTSTAITSTKNTDIEFTAEDGSDVTITALSDGYYIFSIDLSTGKMLVSVEYPLMVGDYRMVYVENEVLGEKPYAKFHPAQSIRGITEGEKLDTVSFFINKTNGKNPAILLQRCSNINGATITWEDIAIQYINDISGANPTAALAPAKKSAELYIGDGCPAVTKDAVYNFVLEQTNTGSHKAQILAENTHLYEGNYYIRTDGAAGGWSKYNTNPDNIMTHSQTALTHGGYDYYFCEWMLQDNNVKYVVANDYSYCVSDTLAKDDIVTDENGNLPANANVRYTWNSSTNALKRAYINGSGTIADRYLVLIGNEYLKDTTGNTFPVGTGDRTGLNANETTFADMGNWLYQVDIKASEKTLVKLTANYNGKIQYFKGAADATVPIITGAENEYKFRLIYDFKTNYLLCGLTEDGEISENITVDEAMIMRSHHELAQTFNVTNAGSIKTIKTIYGVMNFNKSTLNGAGSEHERALYWVSFPFDVNLGEAFGFGNYGEHWIMEYYDGKERAEKGLWKEPTYSYWKYITNPTNYILEAGKGYVLCLDLDLLKESASLWANTDDIALYFPSNDENITIDSNPASKETKVDAWECTIERDDRKTKDSNWNIIGVAGYKNFPDIDTKDLGFYYEYFATNNTYAVNKAAVFNCMHAYMVQFAGTIEWAAGNVTPAAIAARKQSSSKDQYTLRLALQQEGTDHDHTFIRLQEDNVTAEFDMNYDLCKIINSGANIYSMIGNVEVAANVLPVEERIIPLGLDIEEDGNYTFAMPDGTDGITAILIDYETGTETNLLLADYTVELNAGIDNERFALRVRPNHVATEVENTILTDGNDNVKKYIIDGALYLLRDSKLYDAQGRMIQQ
ncbi:MAG: starch-binding protein [Paludibacteraceae bacterium]|nr:starch-binding protein [Paludibacteraceae bacterium]